MDSGRKSEAQRFLRELQDKAYFKERKKIEAANAEKTARLKALRLAKEAEDAKKSLHGAARAQPAENE